MDWHNKTCRRPDIVAFGAGLSCLSCGSIGPAQDLVRPSIRQQSEIRLLRILPGNFTDPVKCDITTESLSSHPLYDAISYTWADETGDDSECCSVQIAGQPVPVTRNCYMALRRVRMQFSPRQVWIDAICIDQSNVFERGHQVGLMPKIYSGARNVLMYVGEATPDSTELVRRLSRSQPLHGSNWLDITSRRYFSRLWTLQEVALARRATLVCGPDSADWGRLRQELTPLRHLQVLPPVFHFDHSIYCSPNKLLDLLVFSQTCQASDPRDKVFALLGLLPSGKIGDLGADYNMSAEDLYIRVAVHLASYLGWRSVLYQAGRQNQHGSLLDSLPSWVPDWSAPRLIADITPPRPSDPDLKGLRYNEASRSITLKLLRAPGLGAEWHEWEEQLAAQCSNYLFLPNNARIAKLALENYMSFSQALEYPTLWNTPALPCGHTTTRVVPIYMRQIGLGQYSLDELQLEQARRCPALCLSIEAAVQVFTTGPNSLLLNGNWNDLLTDIYHHRVWTRPATGGIFKADTFKKRLDYLCEALEHSQNEFLEVLKMLLTDLEPLNGRVEEDSGDDLEGLWMRRFLANELKGVINQDMADDEAGLDESSRLIIAMNDTMWRLLVRCYSMKEVTLEIV